jgi:hypothetical protein
VRGLDGEVRTVWRRLLAGRVAPILVAASAVLIIAVHFVAPVPSGAVHAELARLTSGNQITGFVLMILSFLSAYLLVAPDLHDEFESMTASGGSRPVAFAAARLLVGAAALLAAAVVLGLTVEALDIGGQYQSDEAVHLGVLFADAVPVFILAVVLTCLFGRVAGVVGTFFLTAVGADAAYERGALSDHFIDPSGLLSIEQTLAWLAPRPVMDALPGIALMDQAVALQQFPVREGQAVWGTDLIQVSGPAEITQYAAYLLAAIAVFYIVCRWRAARARSRFHLVPSWLEARRGGDKVDEERL